MNVDGTEDELRDIALAGSLASGDDHAWRRLYALTHLPLLRLLTRSLRVESLAEEALQATYVTAVERIDSYDPDKGSLDGWLAGIARYKALELRRSQRLVPLEVDVPDARPEVRHAEDRFAEAELVAWVLDQLEPRYAEVLRRKYLLDQSLAAMAAELDLPVGTVGTLIHRGRRRFREIYARASDSRAGRDRAAQSSRPRIATEAPEVTMRADGEASKTKARQDGEGPRGESTRRGSARLR